MPKYILIAKRILSTIADALLVAVLVYICLGIFKYDFEQVLSSTLVSNFIGLGLLFLLEAMCITVWNHTPGQALFGLRVQNINGSKLSFGKSFLRGLLIFVEGSLLGLPFYGLVYIAWGINLLKLLITGTAFWDDHLGIVVVDNKDIKPL